ncbi:tRNA (adenosine(37)-N6)-threonylcarbamoyltransferase complex transferase subunit TsaD [Limisphaera ngatamarikiensis]|uniref:tRNA N6-adenosine threonylcarbamoyltransferase n=1 Tax=Limisphaera ngatamarikiensis TaxID=1324935 RepID=A0A6M1RKG2_9BACT|nr:tRNA (adenosine(37)-N6)-threonylcarbamoyltransferase complex transferase subunit TsaD [Limisphaera ngatamarikiensis]NGO40256.1 tRNA (adenosine(37)-N6)-threonylcarbamoyltransferase complex transferase subunit TsaD [Limisphaera ngatamarikiensis]
MTVLAIETSCDETGVALMVNGIVRANAVASQVRLHAEYGGVVPELAAREHLRNLLPVARSAIQTAGVAPEQIDLVAATRGPGLPTALLIGLKAAQAMAFALERPFYGVHHHEAHLYSPWLADEPARLDLNRFEPHVSLIVSGGHTLLVHVEAPLRHRLLGSTLDDAAGECFDKTGKLLGLPYPAGPVIDRMAEHGNPRAHHFPRPLLEEPNDDFSFSGLKTAVRYFLRDNPGLIGDETALRNLCASVQAAIVEVLVAKTVRAACRLGVRLVTASGGVACNRALRKALQEACAAHDLKLRLATPAFCTDNAAMVAALALLQAQHGLPPTGPDAEIRPDWSLDEAHA